MGTSAPPPGRVAGYARALNGQLMMVPGGVLQAAYLHGSAALGGWVPGRSDVDMLFVVEDGISSAAVTRMGEVLCAGAGGCPGRELECSVVTVAQARQPAPPWPFVLHVTAGPGQRGRTVRPEGRSLGDPDLLMHYAVCRAAGWPVCGPPPQDLIGGVPRRAILDYLAGELGWGTGHAPEAYAVLNACRALIYLTDHVIVSKIAGGEAVLSRGAGPAEVIERALAQQRGSEPDQPPALDAVSFVLATAATVRAAAADEHSIQLPPATTCSNVTRALMAKATARSKGGSVERTVRTPDGRALAVQESGDPAGRPVLVHMGTPNSRHLYGPNARDAAVRGLRLISYDRPGYGGSSPQPGRTVADCAGDVRTICAELGIDRLATWGVSGGGPHVLACAALLPDLVTAAASLASPAPYGAEGLDYFAGMGQGNVDDTRLFLTDEAAARVKTDQDREELLATSPEDAAKTIESLLTPTDAAALRGELAEYLTSSAQDGLAPGSQGWWDDNCMIRGWGFDLAAIAVPVLLLHGRQDMFVPFGHGEWLAAHIPGVEARLLDDDGHLTLMQNRVPEVHAWLSEHL